MEILTRGTAELVPYENNPRDNDKAVGPVMESIKEFGFKVPIVIDKDGVIIAGHTRHKAAQRLGLEFVPVIVADDLTPEQVTAFRLADNKVAEKASWDENLLIEEAEKTAETPTTALYFDKPTKSVEHPTMKPVQLFGKQIENSSRPGEKVLDTFGGSGTTLICCEQLGRTAYLCELDPCYCDVIIKRWEKLTGQQAELVEV